MKVPPIFILLFLLTHLPFPIFADINPDYLKGIIKEGWEFLESKNDVYSYRKLTKKGPMAFRSVGIIRAPIMKVLVLLRDVKEAHTWTPNLIKKEIVKEYSYIDAVTYNLNKIPWPAQNRDTLIRSQLLLDETNRWLVVKSWSVEDPKYPPQKGVVRATIYSSNFIFKAIPEGTFIDVDAHIDPKGWVPNWLANIVQKEWPYSFAKALEENANKTKLPDQPVFKEMLDKLNELEKNKDNIPLPKGKTPPISPVVEKGGSKKESPQQIKETPKNIIDFQPLLFK